MQGALYTHHVQGAWYTHHVQGAWMAHTDAGSLDGTPMQGAWYTPTYREPGIHLRTGSLVYTTRVAEGLYIPTRVAEGLYIPTQGGVPGLYASLPPRKVYLGYMPLYPTTLGIPGIYHPVLVYPYLPTSVSRCQTMRPWAQERE